jgi:hypothetical protein
MKKLLIILATLTSSLTLNAGQVFTSGDFYAPCNGGGRDCRFGFEIEMEFEGGVISGKLITMRGVNACRWEDVPVKGTINPDNEVIWRSEVNPVKGCGRLTFNGKKDGDKVVGNFPSFQGKQIEINLKPKN